VQALASSPLFLNRLKEPTSRGPEAARPEPIIGLVDSKPRRVFIAYWHVSLIAERKGAFTGRRRFRGTCVALRGCGIERVQSVPAQPVGPGAAIGTSRAPSMAVMRIRLVAARASWLDGAGLCMRVMEFRKWPVDGGVTADAAQKPGTARRAGPPVSGAAAAAGTMAACAPDPRRRPVVLDRSRQAEKVCCVGGHGGTGDAQQVHERGLSASGGKDAADNGGRTGKATGMVMKGALVKPSNTATARIRPLTTNQWVFISQTIIIAEQQTCRDQQRRW
jgi:hypothetical protein